MNCSLSEICVYNGKVLLIVDKMSQHGIQAGEIVGVQHWCTLLYSREMIVGNGEVFTLLLVKLHLYTRRRAAWQAVVTYSLRVPNRWIQHTMERAFPESDGGLS